MRSNANNQVAVHRPISESIFIDLDVKDGEKYNFDIVLSAISQGNSNRGLESASLMLSGLLSITHSDDIKLTFDDPYFLSPDQPPVIPLPAPALLLLTGLAGLAVARRRAGHA